MKLETPQDLAAQVAAALREDVGNGDVTAALVPAEQRVRGEVIAREDAVLCGGPWVTETYRQLVEPAANLAEPQSIAHRRGAHGGRNPQAGLAKGAKTPRLRLVRSRSPDSQDLIEPIHLEWLAGEGQNIKAGDVIFRISGLARPVLTGERTALNFLQLLSGTATITRKYVDAVAGTSCVILDTRKTLPGLRTAQKYAVRCAGAENHRMGLYDMVLIKENHITAAGSLGAAVAAARRLAHPVRVEVEVESLRELEEALAAKPDIVMLDEFSREDQRAAVALNRSRGRLVKLEASGSVSLDTVREIAETGVDYISIGSLTKHVRALDLSMRLQF